VTIVESNAGEGDGVGVARRARIESTIRALSFHGCSVESRLIRGTGGT
jgi:hypothetical protein